MTLLEAIEDPKLFAPWFKDKATWAAWRAFLAALFALPMTDAQLATYIAHTGRTRPPESAFVEAWLCCGRRAGKSFIMALVAVFLATFRSYRKYLQPGERATVMVIAADRRQARVIIRYIAPPGRGGDRTSNRQIADSYSDQSASALGGHPEPNDKSSFDRRFPPGPFKLRLFFLRRLFPR